VENYVLAFSADHGFSPIPEVEKLRDPAFHGGRIVDGPRVAVGFLDRVNRLLSQRLCLAVGSGPLAAVEGWNLYYRKPLAWRTVEGTCGEAGRLIGQAELDAALPQAVATLYAEEIEDVYLVSGNGGWPDNNVTEFVRNDFDPERSGDAMLIPRPGVLSHWDPGRGSGHGSLYEPDIHVPLIFLGGAVAAGRSSTACTPYDLAPTLAAKLGLTLPGATGRDIAPSQAPQPGATAAPTRGGTVH
jgi:arylsulfatase A-like enzyme